MALTIHGVLQLLEARGTALYGGEAVTQLEHALQAARLAEEADSPPSLVAAALLHDLGHLIAKPSSADDDDVHQYLPLPFLRGVLPAAVLDPIRLHVDAKRYLCYADERYWATLSPASKRSLELQGGIFDADGAQAFLRQPHSEDAVLLRRFDDLAKAPGAATPPLEHYAAILRACALAPAEA
jgi:phosphonate degradation associated HDIG domain protein